MWMYPVEDKRDFYVPLYLLSFRSSFPAVTGDIGNWMAMTFQGRDVQRQADSVLECGGDYQPQVLLVISKK